MDNTKVVGPNSGRLRAASAWRLAADASCISSCKVFEAVGSSCKLPLSLFEPPLSSEATQEANTCFEEGEVVITFTHASV